MQRKPIYYKDTRVAPNSDLYAALQEARNPNASTEDRKEAVARAERIYQECEREYQLTYKGKI
ncbi:transposase [Burkholderia ambifaria]